jgi:hypothetical protein
MFFCGSIPLEHEVDVFTTLADIGACLVDRVVQMTGTIFRASAFSNEREAAHVAQPCSRQSMIPKSMPRA